MAPSNLLLLLLLATATPLITGQLSDYPTANLSTLWTNNNASLKHSITYADGSVVRAIVLRSPKAAFYGPSFAAGFFCPSAPCDNGAFLFAVFIVYTNSGAGITSVVNGIPQVVWSANRLHPVKENATLELTGDGNLILRDADGAGVWSSGTAGRSIAGMMITELGNLVLFDQKNATVWQSFEHPTDALVPGQSLLEGMRLTANTSATNWTQNQLYITVLHDGLYAYVDSTPPQPYFSRLVNKNKTGNHPTQVTLTNGSFSIFVQSTPDPDSSIPLPAAKSTQYMRFENDGHLRLYEWSNTEAKWVVVSNVIKMFPDDDCAFPTVCGEYGVCTGGQCSCPFQSNSTSSYFKLIDGRKPNIGCTPLTPISCQEIQHHELLTLKDVSYFDINTSHTIANARNSDDCKQACLKNCSCQAVMFTYGQNESNGDCLWVTRVFSLQSIQPQILHYNSSAYLKVQLSPSPSATTANKKKAILGAIIGGVTGIVLVLIVVTLYVQRRRKYHEIDEEFDFDQLAGKPMRFSYAKLRECTEDFSQKLGEGGFGSVFEGKLNEERVAVKRLESARQGKKEFMAEVETIGSIEHINLVRLVGFCVEKAHRLLVYEYMPKGSLDRWIYYRHNNAPLDWSTRCRIILDIAKGLCYLHEECRRKIAHLDIKPQNILLDDNFNAKLADFGLSKLIDRDQSKVVTVMRGTPGYLAPEWLTSQITEKVDIYSFGVVVMEVICGRKNIDNSQPEESIHLINLLQEKAQNNRLIDMIDKQSHDMVTHQDKVIQMMKLAMWCLQHDSSRRPLMSTVVKVLEGTMTVETSIDYNFFSSDPVFSVQSDQSAYSAPPLASILSGPR